MPPIDTALKRQIRDAAARLTPAATETLRELVRIPSPSGQEGPITSAIAKMMTAAGWEDVRVDGLGNVLGRIGTGPRVVALDAHIDAVDVTDPAPFPYPPFAGALADGAVWGRGAADQKGGMAAILHAGTILRETGPPPEVSVWAVGSVMEEDCDGLCWNWLVEREGLRPELVVLTEPTGCALYRGHRGRMEMEVEVRGRSAHGSMPELGDNAIYKMARIVDEVAGMSARFVEDPFLGRGSVTVSAFRSESPSLCAVADRAVIHLDRRLTAGETEESAVAEVAALPAVRAAAAEIRVLEYDGLAHTGTRYGMRKYYPTWVIPEDHQSLARARGAYERLFEAPPREGRWTFSTNGVTIMGKHGIPCIGFGPGDERHAHGPDDQCPVADLTCAMAFYAGLAHELAGDEEGVV